MSNGDIVYRRYIENIIDCCKTTNLSVIQKLYSDVPDIAVQNILDACLWVDNKLIETGESLFFRNKGFLAKGLPVTDEKSIELLAEKLKGSADKDALERIKKELKSYGVLKISSDSSTFKLIEENLDIEDEINDDTVLDIGGMSLDLEDDDDDDSIYSDNSDEFDNTVLKVGYNISSGLADSGGILDDESDEDEDDEFDESELEFGVGGNDEEVVGDIEFDSDSDSIFDDSDEEDDEDFELDPESGLFDDDDDEEDEEDLDSSEEDSGLLDDDDEEDDSESDLLEDDEDESDLGLLDDDDEDDEEDSDLGLLDDDSDEEDDSESLLDDDDEELEDDEEDLMGLLDDDEEDDSDEETESLLGMLDDDDEDESLYEALEDGSSNNTIGGAYGTGIASQKSEPVKNLTPLSEYKPSYQDDAISNVMISIAEGIEGAVKKAPSGVKKVTKNMIEIEKKGK
jgi:hypothetical protein